MADIATWLDFLAKQYPILASILALVTALVTSASLVCKALEAITSQLRAKSKALVVVDNDLSAAISRLDRWQRWIGKLALNPSPSADQSSSTSGVAKALLPFAFLAVVASMIPGCSAAQRSKVKADLVDCGKTDILHGIAGIMPQVLGILGGESWSDVSSALAQLGEKVGIDTVICTVSAIEHDYLGSSSQPSSSPAEVPPDTAHVLQNAQRYLSAQPRKASGI